MSGANVKPGLSRPQADPTNLSDTPEPDQVSGQTSRAGNANPATVHHWQQAIASSKHKIVIVPHFREAMVLKPLHRSVDGLLRELRDLATHLLIIPEALRHYGADLLIVRYFSAKVLLATSMGLWLFRKRILFIIHNNIQLAHVWPRERLYFKLLCRLGFQFGFLESADGLSELGLAFRERQFVCVPLPVYPHFVRSPRGRRAGPSRVGVIGRELPEKNTDKLMNLLVGWQGSGDLSAEIVLGSNDSRVLETWAQHGVTTVQTMDYRDYLRSVSDVDVLLIYYDRLHYFYRSSGVIHEAAYIGTAVVCPDFPVFRHQVTQPARVGALFHRVEDMLPAIQSAMEIAKSEPENFKVWAKARCPEEFSRRIDRFLEVAR
jgi:hypothetical protein